MKVAGGKWSGIWGGGDHKLFSFSCGEREGVWKKMSGETGGGGGGCGGGGS